MKDVNGSSEMYLDTKVARGGVWLLSLRIAHVLFRFIRLIILARFLSPNDFGLFGIAFLALSTLDVFSKTGFKEALIQKKGDTKPYRDIAWTLEVVRGLLIAFILFAAAEHVALFFNAAYARPILRVIGLSVILRSLTNISVVYFEKELEFNKYFIYQFAGIIADFAVAAVAAFILRNAWALVLGCFAGEMVRCMMSYAIDPYRPRFRFDLHRAKELFKFGRWLLGSGILIFFITRGGDMLVGKLLGVTALGFYQMAYLISNLPATEITHLISQVSFPAYSKLQDHVTGLREAYLKVLKVTVFLSFPIAGLIFTLAPYFIGIFLGEKWMPMIPAVQVLVFAGLARSVQATAGVVFHAVGKPEIDTRFQILHLFVLGALIYPFTRNWGILGASAAVFLSTLVASIGFSLTVIRIIRCGIREFVDIVIYPFLSIIIAASLVFRIKDIMEPGILEFGILIAVGLLTYSIAISLFDKFFRFGIRAIIRQGLKSLKAA
ncbi:lipopolysaccharide biosynthesis protein [Candidatus Omnitrophota bacterium]